MRINSKITRTILFFCLLSLVMLFSMERVQAQGEFTGISDGLIWVIPIKGDIEPSLAAFVRREARHALNQGADVLIFEIDTFGGRVDSALQITSFIMSVRGARTVAWVTSGEESMGVSWSAGALIALACAEIYMAPGTSIGAAAPVLSGMEGAVSADEKTVAAVRSQMAALAERNNHPVGLALAMVDYDVELWEVEVDGRIRALTTGEIDRLQRERERSGLYAEGDLGIERIGLISEPGKLLSLTAGEALMYGLASDLVYDREALLDTLGIRGEIVESAPSMADDIISVLTSGGVQTILILLGLVMIFLEIQSPGIGVPGTVAIIAFLTVFGSSALLGRVGSLEIILFILGIAMLAVELFVLPGFGLLGISGILLIGSSLVFSMQDFVIPTLDWEWELLGRNSMVVFVGIIAAVVGIAILALLGPKIKIFDRIMLKTVIAGTAGGPDLDFSAEKAIASGITEDEENFTALVGKIGTTDSILRPSGRAVIEGNVYTVEADGEFVDAGRGIVVTKVRGNRIIVKRV